MPDPSLLTRETLLIRLRDAEDERSWAEFTDIYTPLLYGFCLKRGISREDSADIIQSAMANVSCAIRGFDYDPKRGKFKTWLFTVVRNAISGHFRKENRKPLTPGETQLVNRIDDEASKAEVDEWERDYQRQLLAWAMDKIQPDFGEHVWSAFVETAIRGRSNRDVAEELDMTPNAVGVAKHRVTQRLRSVAQSVDAERWEGELMAGG
jgi:RNA polymerase sigma-70 factor (ECF subfamily)